MGAVVECRKMRVIFLAAFFFCLFCDAQPFQIKYEVVGLTCSLAITHTELINLNGTTCQQQSCSIINSRTYMAMSQVVLCDTTSVVAPFQFIARPYGIWAQFGTRATGGNAVRELYNEGTCSNGINLIQRDQFWEPVGRGCLPDLQVPTFWAW